MRTELGGLEATWDEVQLKLATAIRATSGEGFHIQPTMLLRVMAMPAAQEALEKYGAHVVCGVCSG